MQGFRIHTRVWRRKIENSSAGVSLCGDQLVVLFGGVINQNAAVTDLDCLVETGSVGGIHDCSPRIWNLTPASPSLDYWIIRYKETGPERIRRSESPPAHLFLCGAGADRERQLSAFCP